MFSLEITASAENDLSEIISYIAMNLNAPKAATDFADEVFNCYDRLEENPYIYEECRDARLKKEGYRRAVIKNYVLIYKVYEGKNEVVVQRFFYGGQDYVHLI